MSNNQTGELYMFRNNEELKRKLEELDRLRETMSILQQAPSEKCPCCKGAGSVKMETPFYDEQGIMHRYIPCFCTFKKSETPDNPFVWMRSWLNAYQENQKDIDVEKIMDWIDRQPMTCGG